MPRTEPDIWIYLRDETDTWNLAGLDLAGVNPRMIGVYVADSHHIHICSMNLSVEALFVETVPLGVPNTAPDYEEFLDIVEEADQGQGVATYFAASDFEGALRIDQWDTMPPGCQAAKFWFPRHWDLEELAESREDGDVIRAALDEAWEDARCNAYF